MKHYPITLRWIGNHFPLLDGEPPKHGLESDLAHIFTQGAVWWLADGVLSEDQGRAISRNRLHIGMTEPP